MGEGEPGRWDRETLYRVTITRGFYMQKTEVTQGQWRAVMGENPSHFKECGDDCPVENVSWDDAQKFIKRLNEIEKTNTYRLPTEAEWEYACRAGTNTLFSFGPCLSTSEANYDGRTPLKGCSQGEYRGKTIPVASLAANGWGLFDMHGNVWEWCQDWYGSYPTGDVVDPQSPEGGSGRVLRGGSWGNDAGYCRSAYRGNDHPGDRYGNLGFRLVRSLP
jgi:sulfatase modifying factor 1